MVFYTIDISFMNFDEFGVTGKNDLVLLSEVMMVTKMSIHVNATGCLHFVMNNMGDGSAPI
jgi:hypothetical protein